MYRFMEEAGPQGVRAAAMTRDMRHAYATEYLQELRRPLSKLFGSQDKPVDPIAAMDRLSAAARDGNLTLLRPFMRVLREKGSQTDPERAVAALIQHMTGNVGSLSEFVKGFGQISQESRSVLFQGSRGVALRRELERFERIFPRLQRYENAVNQGGGLDLTSRGNMLLGAWAVANWQIGRAHV